MVRTTESIWTMQNIGMIKGLIRDSQSIVISGHTNPDGDSIGALLSLGLGLEAMGKRVFMICDSDIPRNYRYLPGASRIIRILPQPVDLAIAVDCGSKEMIGQSFCFFERAGVILEIDHHKSRTPFGDYSFVDPGASSAGELVHTLLTELEVPITEDIAQNILTSIIVETNSFRLPGLNSHTFEVCADLLRTGVEFNKLSETVYWVTSRETALLQGLSMQRCMFSDDGELAWSTLTRRDMERIGASDSDSDPVVERIRSIRGVRIAILFREKNFHQWRVSFRSKEGVNVAKLAEQFGGGGHASAAGCCIPKKKEIREKLLLEARQLLADHQKSCMARTLNPSENTAGTARSMNAGLETYLPEERIAEIIREEPHMPVVPFYETVQCSSKKNDQNEKWHEEVPLSSCRIGA